MMDGMESPELAEVPSHSRKVGLPARFRQYELWSEHSDTSQSVPDGPRHGKKTRRRVALRHQRVQLVSKVEEASTKEEARISEVAEKAPRKFPCKVCGRVLDSRLKRTRHQFTHTGAASQAVPPQCSECKLSFSSRLALTEHQAWHEGKMLYSCPKCGRQFRQNTGLWRHLRTHIPGRPHRPRHRCATCSQEFSRADYLRAHAAAHANTQARFMCALCGRGFLQGSDLKRHRVTHTGQRLFECAVCGRSFSDRSSRNRHQREHDPAQRYPCSSCGMSFTRASRLREHTARVHSNDQAWKGSRSRPPTQLRASPDDAPSCHKLADQTGARESCDVKTALAMPSLQTPPRSLLGDTSSTAEALADVNGQAEDHESATLKPPVLCGPEAQLNLDELLLSSVRTNRAAEEMLEGQRADKPTSSPGLTPRISEQGTQDVVQRSLNELPLEAMALQEAFCGNMDFVSAPDFGSQAYYNWLAGFTSVCNLLSAPLDRDIFGRATQVLKTVSDALAHPMGILACPDNFRILLGISEDLQRVVGRHLSFVLQHLES